MDKINGNTDPRKSKSMLFRLFSGDRSAIAPEDNQKEVSEPEDILTDVGQVSTEALPESAPEPQEVPAPETDNNTEAEQPSSEISNSAAAAPVASVASPEVDNGKKTAQPSVEPPQPEPKPEPVDAGIEVRILKDCMEANVYLTAPQNGGNEVNAKAIRAALKDAGVVNGIMDRAMFEIAMNKPYNFGAVLVAQGTPKEDGTDARIVENFPREIDLSPYQNADGTVDFKRLSIVREVKAGTVIAYQEPFTEGTDGTNVKGESIKARSGKAKQLLRGPNTILSEDGMQLLVEKDGHLAFRGGRFEVDTTFTVDASVDNTTGNITFFGDVLIRGDVREGYTIRSGGAVKVKGVVEGGSIYATGDINIDGGFNGMKRGELETSKHVTSKFLQNCTVKTKGDITTGAVINSIIFCDGKLIVTKDKGVIVGGRCTVLYSIEAKVIGTDVNTPTQITVGLSPSILAEKQEMEKAINEVEESKDMLNKNLIYLERCAKMGKLSDKNLALQESCNKQKVLIMVREATYHKRLEAIGTTIEEAAAGSSVKVQTIYPSTKISIKSQSIMVKALQHRCIFRMEKGELITATF